MALCRSSQEVSSRQGQVLGGPDSTVPAHLLESARGKAVVLRSMRAHEGVTKLRNWRRLTVRPYAGRKLTLLDATDQSKVQAEMGRRKYMRTEALKRKNGCRYNAASEWRFVWLGFH